MKKRITQAQKKESYIQGIKKQFCEKFEWTEEYYCDKEFKRAFAWLKFYDLPDSISYSKTFWNWWKISCAMINEDSIKSGELQQIHFNEMKPFRSTFNQILDESLAPTT